MNPTIMIYQTQPEHPKIYNILPTSKPYTHPGKRYICTYLHQNGCNIWFLNTLELNGVNNRKYKKSILLCSKNIILCKIKHHNAAKKELDGRC